MEIILTLDTIKRILANECKSRIVDISDMYVKAALYETLADIEAFSTLAEAEAFTDCYTGMSLQEWANSL